jgi:hypothetical protein
MRASLAALTTVASVLVLGGCASDVGSGIDEARSSAASIGAGVRSSAASIGAGLKQACDASKSQLTTLDDLGGKLAEDSGRAAELAPQVRRTADQLAASAGDRAQLRPVVAAGRDLVKAIGDGNRSAVELSGRQAQVAARSAQALCTLAR